MKDNTCGRASHEETCELDAYVKELGENMTIALNVFLLAFLVLILTLLAL